MSENGHVYAHEQYVYENIKEPVHAAKPVEVIEDYLIVGVKGEGFNVMFAKNRGLTSYKHRGNEYIRVAPRPNFFRAATNNDVENKYGFRHGQWLQASLYADCKFVKVERSEKNEKEMLIISLNPLKKKNLWRFLNLKILVKKLYTLYIQFMGMVKLSLIWITSH